DPQRVSAGSEGVVDEHANVLELVADRASKMWGDVVVFDLDTVGLWPVQQHARGQLQGGVHRDPLPTARLPDLQVGHRAQVELVSVDELRVEGLARYDQRAAGANTDGLDRLALDCWRHLLGAGRIDRLAVTLATRRLAIEVRARTVVVRIITHC